MCITKCLLTKFSPSNLSLFGRIFRHRNIISKVIKMSASNISISSEVYEKALEDLKNNPFYEKYSAKINILQQESPDEFKEKIKSHEEKKNRKPSKVDSKERPYSVASEQGKPQLETSFAREKKLDDIMKTELLKDKTDEEIKDLWIDYHKSKDDVVVGVVPKHTYELMHERGKEFSTFLLPIPRSQGYEFIMCQFVAHEVHFTPLIAFQTHKENAPECLTITFYPDLQEEKGIILMKGEYDNNILNCQEAQCLVNELQLYYAQHNEKRLNLMRRFTYQPSEFNHMDLIAELETLSL